MEHCERIPQQQRHFMNLSVLQCPRVLLLFSVLALRDIILNKNRSCEIQKYPSQNKLYHRV